MTTKIRFYIHALISFSFALVFLAESALAAPVAPPSVSAEKGGFAPLDVSWQAPASGDPVAFYKIYRADGADSLCSAQTQLAISGTTSYADNTAALNKTYYYRITSVNGSGEESPCNSPRADGYILNLGQPEPPKNVQATQSPGTTITVSWDPPDVFPNREAITGFKLWALQGNTSPCFGTAHTTLPSSASSYVHTNLNIGDGYYYSMKSTSANGEGNCSNVAFGRTLVPPPPLPTAASQGDYSNKIDLSFTPPEDPHAFITHYVLYRSELPGNACVTAEKLRDIPAPGTVPTSMTVADSTNVVPGVMYYYSMKSLGGASPQITSTCSDIVSGFARIGPPPNVQATDGDFTNKVRITWDPPVGGGPITGYHVYRNTTCQAPALTQNPLPLTPRSLDDTNVTPGVTYQYSVRALSAAGQGACSNPDPGFARPPICSNSLDDDGDGEIDHPDDPGCTSPQDDDERDKDGPICDNGKDDDGDSKSDYPDDPGCSGPDDPTEEDNIPACRNSLDDDGDGTVDFPNDPGCSSPDDDDERDKDGPVCDNGKDDDGDSKPDFPNDPGCSSPGDGDETDDQPVCNNGNDDDSDGEVDYPNDPGCTSPTDDNERDKTAPVCDNGEDDDLDSIPDYPDDPGCFGPTDESEDDGDSPLKSPAFAKFNTFLGQWNFAELINQGPNDREVGITVLNLHGQEMIHRDIVVPADSEVDVDVNGLVKFACDVLNSGCAGFEDLSETQGAPNGQTSPDGVVDTYGLVRFDFDDENSSQRILGRMSFYRPNPDGTTYSFAFARELRNASTGKTYATANTFDPQGMGYLVPNWAEVINFEAGSQTFTLNIYSQDGVLKDTATFTLPPLGEFDFQAGHEFLDENGNLYQGVYLVEVVPDSDDTEYFLSVSRYSSNAPAHIHPETYNFAFSLDGNSGSIEPLFAPINNQIDGVQDIDERVYVTNWVEVANVGSGNATVAVRYKNSGGSVLSDQIEVLVPKSQMHFHASALLAPDTSGSVEILSDRPVVAQSMSYVHGPSNNLETGFASPARTMGRAEQAGTINTFLQMQDVLQAYSTTDQNVDALFEITSFRGGKFSGSLSLGANSTSALEISNNNALNFPPDTYGAIILDTTEPGRALAEVRRVRVVKGEVDYVMPTAVR